MTDAPGPELSKLTPEQRALLERMMIERSAAAADSDVIPRRQGDNATCLSFAQERLWVVEQIAPGSPSYHIADAFLVEGDLDVTALRRAVEELIARHESLRTTFAVVDGRPVQFVAAVGDVDFQEDTVALQDEAFEQEVQRVLAAESERSFDLEHGPLLRVRVFHVGANRHVVQLTMHHIVSDAWSRDVLFRELSALYDAIKGGRPSPLAELPIQYPDYAEWQRERLTGAVLHEQMAYWRGQLADIPTLELPAARRRTAAERQGRGASAHAILPKPLSRAIVELCRAEDVTVSMLTLTGLDILLQRYCGQDDIVVGSPVAGRDREELNDLVGFFVNMLVMRTRLDGDPSVREVLARVRGTVLDAYDHQDIPFEKLVDEIDPQRDLTRNPLFQVVFQYGRATGTLLASTGLAIKPLGVDLRTTRFDLEAHVAERDEDILVSFIYDDHLFDASTVQRMLAHYQALLEGLVADPERRISSLPLLGEDERRQVLLEWNETSTGYPCDATVPELFEAEAAEHPDAVALSFEGEAVTYAELNRRANQVAHLLRRRGVGPEVMVGVCVERSVELVVGVLGILKAGGAYVPLDPSYPAPRLALMMEDTRTPVLLTQASLVDELPEYTGDVIRLDADWSEIAREPTRNLEPVANAESLAYVMYTSGSTGRPKGVCVTHRSVVRLVRETNYIDIGVDDVLLQFAPISFDASTLELWGSLLNGARLAIFPPHTPALDELGRAIEAEGITTLWLTGALFQQMVDAELDRLRGVRQLLAGGDALSVPHVERFIRGLEGDRRLINGYGPTENTTFTCCHVMDAASTIGRTVPIGRPIANTGVYILDAAMLPVPVGAPGELYTSGDGLARGYLNDEELTAQKFVPNPFDLDRESRLYRTGDKARYRGDGTIEFLGRIDHQVKVRGYRIELGEIEAALCRHDALREAVVLCREDAPGDKRLVAYVVAGEEDAPAAELRSHLRETLPDYMVPSAFVHLESLPLTPVGKIDRRSLPEPDRSGAAGDYVAPCGPVEERLAGIWSDVLRLERVGVHDNFFEVGGDSILSILVVSRLREAGLHLTPAQVFQHQTIAELAELVRDDESSEREREADAGLVAEQGVVTGEVQLTPIQHWFFEKSLVDAHHFNQSVLMSLDTEVSPEICRDVAAALVEHHDALRLRFARDESGRWVQHDAAPSSRDDEVFSVVDLSDTAEADRAAAVERVGNELQASLDLTSGPLLRVAMIDIGPGEPVRLLCIVHHLAVDGVSWRILLEDFQRACEQRLRGEAIQLHPKTMSFQQWAERQSELARSDQLDSELDGWCAMSADDAAEIPVDHADGENTVEQERTLSFSLSADRTKQLLQEVPRAYNTRINDVLLTALVMAFGRWSGRPRLQFDMEGHGREPLLGREDVSRTIGWFTSVYPLVLHVDDPADPRGALKSVKEQLHSVPRQGVGYGVLRYLRPDDDRAAPLRAMRPSPISFNYLGQFDQQFGEESIFGTAPESGGALIGPRNDRLHLLDVIGSVAGGQLHLGLSYSAAIHDEATVERFCEHLEDALEQLIAHCTMPGAGGVTPSDFPLAVVDQASLDLLVEEYGREDIEDLYALTPMQQGIRFHALRDAAEGVYLQQMRPRLSDLDAPAFLEAWQRTIDHHPVLRTSVVAPGGGEPLQLVHRRARMPVSEHDLRGKSDAEQAALIDQFMRDDLARGLDMASPVPMRVALLRLNERDYDCVWTFHHVAVDGWSCGLILKEVVACYLALTRGETPSFDSSPSYREYIEWLQEQDLAEAESFWRRRLAGLDAPTLLAPEPRADVATEPGEPKYVEHEVFLDPEVTRRLNEFARGCGITLNTLTVGAWSLVMRQFTGEEDVAFGTIVSGRPAEIRNIETMIGLMINTLPLRVSILADEPVSVWLRALQNDQLAQRSYEHNPLWQVQQWSDVPSGTPLFDTLYVFENYPVDRASAAAWGELVVGWERPVERTGYPLVVAIVPHDRLLLRLTYDRERFTPSEVDRLIRQYALVLEQVAGHPEATVGTLSTLEPAERDRILVEWNETSTGYPRDATVPELFEAEAAEHPDAVALSFEGEAVTYAELNRRANQVAHLLRRRGVGPEVMVGVCVERSVELVVGVLGILKAGGAYVPLDPSYPAPRLALMMEDTRTPVLLTQASLVGELPEYTGDVIRLDADWSEIAREPTRNLEPVANAESLAYVMYTSGSTGRPKGVCVTHRSVVRLVRETNYIDIGVDDVLLQFAPISFDASTLELWGSLLNGARLAIFPPHTPALDELGRAIEAEGVTTLWLTGALFQQMVDAELDRLRGVRQLLAGGDALSVPHVERFIRELEGDRRLINGYGPTENTTFTCCHVMDAASTIGRTVPIGRPIANTGVYILDAAMLPVPVGAPGELYTSGDGLARGYLNDEELTAQKFVPNPFDRDRESRLYRTGDKARYRGDGTIEFLGRIDHQVKLRGFRIELGEIEAALCRHDALREAVVLCREDAPGDKRLVAYVLAGEEDAPAAELRSHLREMLPDYMVPSAFVHLESLPLTPVGKVDRRALPVPEGARQVAEPFVAPRIELEATIAGIWREILDVEKVGVRDNFFDLGGHSLLLLRVHARLKEALDHELSITDLFEHPTIESLVARMGGGLEAEPVGALGAQARARTEARRGTGSNAIAIIGMAGRFPGADDVETLWSNLESGVESIRFYTDEELRAGGVDEATLRAPGFVKAGGALEGVERFDARHFGYTPREAELIDPQQRVFLECAWHALERASYDPERFEGLIGVYAGAGQNAYLANVQSHPELLTSAGLSAVLSSGKDFLPTRVSYKLNLRGPSMNIQTACSTSLVAVHEACRSLLDQQCDIALAGGVAVSVPAVGGYMYQEGGILSPDGRCRTFDARARGTLGGDGVGIVVLKRLDEALRDGDEVHAVILGTAVNNDGSNKVGYTAPSVDGQAEVVAMAQAAAAVDPETITYIEAHGTATPLGDPIEVAALTKVFREQTDRTGFCGLSALKSNVGHLDAAAGVAGLIKTALALEHRTLPPVLHFESPNPEIDFENSPFYVITERCDWEVEEGKPRRAGVSSFGLGGTNAHAVLEEAPELAPSEPSRGCQLLVLSAKNQEALDAVTADLAAHLAESQGANESVNLADVAYTLQVGRRELEHRRAVRCQDVAEAIAGLAGDRRELVDDGHAAERARPVAFLFPGQGTQTVNMGVEMYREPGAFREAADACFAILDGELGLGLRETIYPDGPLTDEHAGALHERLTRTSMAQPALFVVSYAVARQWMEWGIEPESMIGHSIGEFVAACVSGVLSLEDALRLVVERGRLMEAMPPGAMTAVPLPAERVEALLDGAEGDGLWLSVVNAPSMCVVSGAPERITAFENRLASAGTECRRLHTSHAFHSGLMDGAVQPFVEAVRGVTIEAPRIPYASNVTGDWITEADVRDPRYWGRQIRHAVRFAEGMERLLEDPSRVVLEVGPGTALTSLARLQESFGSERVAVSSLGRAGSGESAASAMTGALGRLWAGGVRVDWARVHGDARRRRVTLPTYPFQRERYWVERRQDSAATASASGPLVRRADLAEWFYTPVWRRSRAGRRPAAPATILVFARDTDFDRQVVAQLEESGRAVVVVRAGTSFQATGGSYAINPTAPGDYARLLDELRRDSGLPGEVVHLWTLSFEAERLSEEKVEALDELGIRALLLLVQAFESLEGDAKIDPLRIDVVTDGAQDVTGRELVQPEKATVLGFCRIVPLELSDVSCRGIDLAASVGAAPGAELAEHVARECLSASEDAMVAYRDGHRWVQSFVRLDLDAVEAEPPSRLRDQGVYLVTGGFGGMGLELAGELARSVRARLILTGRTVLPAREDWAAHLAEHGEDEATDRLTRVIKAVEAIEGMGAEVMLAQADVADLDQMQAVVEEARKRFGRIDGVLHLAGIAEGGPAVRTGRDELARTFGPKIGGARVLEQLFRETPLDFMALASSLMTSWGVPGMVGYCAANTYLDAFARRFAADTGTYTVSIDWTRWSEIGMAVDLERDFGRATTARGVSSQEGVEAFRRIVDRFDEAQVLVSEVDFREALSPRRLKAIEDALSGDATMAEVAPEHLHPRQKLSTEYEAPRNETEEKLAAIWQGLFGIDRLGVHDNFFELGGDSVLSIQIVARAKAAGIALGPTSLFEHQTIAELAAATGEGSGAVMVAEQGPVVGEVPLTPIQRWFFDHDFADAHHFNHGNMVALRTRLSAAQWEAIVRALLGHHDALRMRFGQDEAAWRQSCAEPADPVPLEIVDLADLEEAEHRPAIETRAAELQRSLDLSDGPVARFALFDLGPAHPQRLLIVIHHLVVDVVSWPILLQDMGRLVEQVERGEPTELPPKTTSFRTWSRRLEEHAQSAELKAELSYWVNLPWDEVAALPVDHPAVDDTTGTSESVGVSLDVDQTSQLLGQLSRADGVQVPEILLTAVAHAVATWSGSRSLTVDVEGHGREPLFGDVDLTRTVGWFTSMYPVLLCAEPGAAPGEALPSVRERVRESRERGIGYGLLRYLHEDDTVRQQLASLPAAEIVFLYLGQADAGGGGDEDAGIFARADESAGPELSPRAQRHHLLEIAAGVAGGRLHVNWTYSASVHERATIERLAERFLDALRELITRPALESASQGGHPLSFAQQRMWLLDQLGVGAAYNMSLLVRLSGPLDAGALERGLAVVVERHAVLRTTFATVDGNPVQVIAPSLDLPFLNVDLRELPEAEREGEALRRAGEVAARPFDLSRGPLLRPVLYRLGDAEHILLLAMHHLVTDGWSVAILTRELTESYRAFVAGETPNLPDLPIQYADFARWQRERLQAAELEKQLGYWREHLSGDLPVLQLPTDHQRPALQTFDGAKETRVLPMAVCQALKERSREHGVTLAMTLMAAFKTLLLRYTGQDDVILGTPIGNRTREEDEHLIGVFINTLAMRTDLSGDPTFSELLGRERKVALGAYDNQDLPFERLVEELALDRDLSRTPIFSVLFAMENAPGAALQLGDVTLSPVDLGEMTTRFDLEVYLREIPDGLRTLLIYNRNLFDAPTMARMGRHFANLLTAVAEDPSARLSALPILDDEERAELVARWSGRSVATPVASCVHELFEAQAVATPEAVALSTEDETVTYDELNRRANQVAQTLRRRGVRRELMVGLCVERSVEMVVGALGILKAGGAYVPLDPALPQERLAFMLEDTAAPVLVTQDPLRSLFPDYGGELVLLGAPSDTASGADDAPLPAAGEVTPDDLAYVIFTSGSTGKPKGVQVRHGGVLNFLLSMAREPGLEPQDVLLAVTTLSFDIAALELFLPLSVGARVEIASREVAADGALLAQMLAERGITVMQATPATWQMLLNAGWQSSGGLKVLCGGEELPRPLAEALLAHGGELWNLYGPTETTIWSAVTRVEPDPTGGPVSLGRPIDNTQLLVLDERLVPVPQGVPGELHIGGAGLARGYLNRPELTQERFVESPWPDLVPGRLYKTGDLVRYDGKGQLVFLGRMDHQVKLRGHRIELGEIESVLAAHPDVAQAVVMAREDRTDDRTLAAYVVAADGRAPGGAELRDHLRARLPDYMIPASFVPLDAFPVTSSGKVDRRALPAPSGEREVAGAYVAPRGEVEGRIADIWLEVLGVDQVGVRDNFFDLGGHSLRAIQVHARLKEEFDTSMPVLDMFRYPTVEALAGRLSGGDEEVRSLQREAGSRFSGARRASEDSIAIVGMAGRFPKAPDIETFWKNLRAGEELIHFFTDEELREAGIPEPLIEDPNYVAARGVLEDVDRFDAWFFGYNPREAEIIDPQQRIFLECAWEAMERAGYDPGRYPGLVGVYAGSSVNSYLQILQSRPEAFAGAGPLQTIIGNDKDFLATRASYKLNLRGPSMSVQTACSTSLVAIHEACRNLLENRCDMALAGGVSVVLPVGGYMHTEGGIASPDGHCRVFDAGARGTLGGNGVGIVVLKRLAEAVRDGDAIHAVIRGTAVNNDGSDKVGFTAPSVDGQAEVIALAQAAAGVDPDTIEYVEAHGTGTVLGDPIEVAALTRVFRERTARKGFCALGSVKSNMGHLDAAAGVGGLIKAVLAIEHGEVPPSLHFEEPNPEIDFEGSPFYVPTTCRAWSPEAGGPRRAGVSSFGLGGTNAHAVLEQAPQLAPSGPSRDWQLLVLSAKSAPALEHQEANLAAHLAAHPDVNLADVAHTLQVGRAEFEHRCAVAARSASEAAELLGGADRAAIVTRRAVPAAHPVVFMFPGQGSQYVDMGRGLYERERTFREVVDRCLALLRDEVDLDLRPLLYPIGDAPPDAAEQLQRTEIAQPALFVVEYALAELWRSWGIEPEACIGHSIGEYVAAVVSGVLSWEDGLRLVALRGRLMGAMPVGVMTAVPLPAARVRELLADATELWLSVVSAPSVCVVSGTAERVAAFETQLLERDGISCQRLHTSHAFHSGLMDGAEQPFVEAVREVPRRTPKIPYVSNVTGTWITEQDVQDASYWGRHIRQAVLISPNLEHLLEDRSRVLLEVGPGEVLGGLARQHDGGAEPLVVVSTLRRPDANGSSEADAAFLTQALGKLWTAGVDVDWARYRAGEQRRRLPLPTYPFQRERFWIEPDFSAPASQRAGLDDWFWVPGWRRAELPAPVEQDAGGHALVFTDASELAEQVTLALTTAGLTTTVVEAADGYRASGDGFAIEPSSLDDARRLVTALAESGRLPARVVHLWGAASVDAPAVEREELGFFSVLNLARSLGESGGLEPIGIDVITTGVQEVLGDECIEPSKALVLGPCRVIGREFPDFSCRNVDLDARDIESDARQVAERLVGDVLSGAREHSAWRGSRRYVETFARVPLETGAGEKPGCLREGGTYLITGGMGGMGLVLAGHLASELRANLVLVGRTPLPPRDGWDSAVAEGDADDVVRSKVEAIRAMEAAGAQVMTAAADVADVGAMEKVVAAARHRFGPIHGVIHASGVAGGGVILLKEREEAERVLQPKVAGTRVLEHLFGDGSLDFLVLCSSVTAILGDAAQVDYAAANAYLDAFARRFLARTGTHTVSINWNTWREVGMAVDTARNLGLGTIHLGASSREGVEAFRRILGARVGPQVVVHERDLIQTLSGLEGDGRPGSSSGTDGFADGAGDSALLHARPDIGAEFVAPQTEVEHALAEIWQGLLGIDQVGSLDDFFELGGHSLLATQLLTRVRNAFQVSVVLGDVFEAPTLGGLAALVEERVLEDIEQLSEDDVMNSLGESAASSTPSRETPAP